MECLERLFGFQVRTAAWEHTEELPAIMREIYTFLRAEIDGQPCVVMVLFGDFPTIPGLIKQIKMVKLKENLPVILKVETISALRRKKLVEAHIGFIAGEKQVYLPHMATYLESKEVQKEAPVCMVEQLMYSSQQLALWYLYQAQSRAYVSEAAKTLTFSAMTMTRATRQLEATTLFHVDKDGVNKVLQSTMDKVELLEKLRPFLRTPVKFRGYMKKTALTVDYVLAGYAAAQARKGQDPGKMLTYAIDARQISPDNLEADLIDAQTQVAVEGWYYDPQIFARDGIADVISVQLSRNLPDHGNI